MRAAIFATVTFGVFYALGYMTRAAIDGPELGWLDYAAWLSLAGIGWLVRDVIGIRVDQDAARLAEEPTHGHEQLREIEL